MHFNAPFQAVIKLTVKQGFAWLIHYCARITEHLLRIINPQQHNNADETKQNEAVRRIHGWK